MLHFLNILPDSIAQRHRRRVRLARLVGKCYTWLNSGYAFAFFQSMHSTTSIFTGEKIMPVLDLSPDELLTTTRSVRRRLDFSRPVEPEVIRECLEIALQAPTGGNRQGWHFVVVTDAEKRQALGDIYRRGFVIYRKLRSAAGTLFADDLQRAATQQRVMDSAEYLAAHMH